jgi:hypothetical protein
VVGDEVFEAIGAALPYLTLRGQPVVDEGESFSVE